jgi:D-3-phosphoglycerate dehydrogenase / 2-oxoglutarate reductase
MRVLVADRLSEAGIEALAERFDVDVRTGLDNAALLEAIPAYDGIVIRSSTTVDADVIAAAERLKVIARAGIGLDNVDVNAATAKGIIVCNAPQSNVISAAEHTVALLLALARRIPAAAASLRAGEWKRSAFEGVELHGKALGVLGLGRVGMLVAQRCSAFGMRLVAYDPFVSTEWATRIGVELLGSVEAVCAQADVITVHLPKTAETTGLIGEHELRSMKPTALIVNTARGGIVDEDALYTALSEGWIAGAALDVFSTEPVTDSPLFKLDNIVVTPHLGASTAEAQDKAGTMVAQAVRLALEGEFVPSAVNVQVGTAVPEAVKPFMPLVEQLGRVLTGLHSGQAGEIVVEYHGKIAREDTQVLTLSALKGVLKGVVSEPVTFVNAPLLAEERGLKVSTIASEAFEDFVSLVRLRLGDARVAGTLVGPKNKPRLVEVWGFGVDMELSDHMLFFRYTDRPGIVGIMGNRLGNAQVNIATMQVGREKQGGDAVIAMSIDSAAPPEVIEDIRERIGAQEARAIDLA